MTFYPDNLHSFSLLETILWKPVHGYFLLDYHLKRLQNSALYFNVPIDIEFVLQQLASVAMTFISKSYKVRLLIAQDGSITCEAILLEKSTNRSVRLCLSAIAIDPTNPFLYHKTTNRQIYQLARSACIECDDTLLYNNPSEITETCIGNIVVCLKGELLTPPVECGLLPGTFRAVLLAQGKIKERIITIEMLQKSDRIFVINSVRKWRKARFYVKVYPVIGHPKEKF